MAQIQFSLIIKKKIGRTDNIFTLVPITSRFYLSPPPLPPRLPLKVEVICVSPRSL